jgi:hypothetical protein
MAAAVVGLDALKVGPGQLFACRGAGLKRGAQLRNGGLDDVEPGHQPCLPPSAGCCWVMQWTPSAAGKDRPGIHRHDARPGIGLGEDLRGEAVGAFLSVAARDRRRR